MATKTERLEMRLRREHKEMIEEAAAVQGQPLTAFALSTLIDRARDVLAKHRATVLTRRDMKRFTSLIEEDSAPNAALKRAVRRSKPAGG